MPLGSFKATMAELDPWDATHLTSVVFRYRVRLHYSGDPFATVPLECTIDATAMSEQTVAIVALDPLQLPALTMGALLSLPRQVAEKLHACTEPDTADVVNERVSDVYDLLLISKLMPFRALLDAIRSEAIAVFEARGKHSWPPTVTARRDWERVWANYSQDLPFEEVGIPIELSGAIAELQQLIDAVHAAFLQGSAPT